LLTYTVLFCCRGWCGAEMLQKRTAIEPASLPSRGSWAQHPPTSARGALNPPAGGFDPMNAVTSDHAYPADKFFV
jgi:hypothetical protein